MLLKDPTTSDTNAFEPETIKVMHKAYTEVCVALHVIAGDQSGREAIASRVIDLARAGVTDPAALRDRVLLESQLAA